MTNETAKCFPHVVWTKPDFVESDQSAPQRGAQSFELAMRTDLSAASTKPGTACDSAL